MCFSFAAREPGDSFTSVQKMKGEGYRVMPDIMVGRDWSGA